jgi:hypothetical protein
MEYMTANKTLVAVREEGGGVVHLFKRKRTRRTTELAFVQRIDIGSRVHGGSQTIAFDGEELLLVADLHARRMHVFDVSSGVSAIECGTFAYVPPCAPAPARRCFVDFAMCARQGTLVVLHESTASVFKAKMGRYSLVHTRSGRFPDTSSLYMDSCALGLDSKKLAVLWKGDMGRHHLGVFSVPGLKYKGESPLLGPNLVGAYTSVGVTATEDNTWLVGGAQDVFSPYSFLTLAEYDADDLPSVSRYRQHGGFYVPPGTIHTEFHWTPPTAEGLQLPKHEDEVGDEFGDKPEDGPEDDHDDDDVIVKMLVQKVACEELVVLTTLGKPVGGRISELRVVYLPTLPASHERTPWRVHE